MTQVPDAAAGTGSVASVEPVGRSKDEIDVVIVNWNSGRQLASCLASLRAQDRPALIASITIVDNASSDGSADDAAPADLPVSVDRSDRNLGFAAGCNRGARAGSAEFVLFLNPDTALLPGALDAGLAAFAQHPEVGIVGLQLVDGQGRPYESCSRFPTPTTFFMRALALDRLAMFKRFRSFYGSDIVKSAVVDQVMGACFFMRRKELSQLGGLDERFFMYFEDVDLAARVKSVGKSSWLEMSARVMHTGGGSSAAIPDIRLFYFLRSRLTYSRKHFSVAGHLAVLFVTLAVEPWTRLALAWRRHGAAGAKAVVTGYRLLWQHLLRET